MSLKDCGLGMKRFSDDAQRLKWSAIQRLLTSKRDSGVAAANLVQSAIRLFSHASASSNSVLLTSVFQWAEANSQSLVKSPTDVCDELRLRMATMAGALASEQGQCRLDSFFTDGLVIMSDLEVRDALSSRESLIRHQGLSPSSSTILRTSTAANTRRQSE
jgi:hypothetical protein